MEIILIEFRMENMFRFDIKILLIGRSVCLYISNWLHRKILCLKSENRGCVVFEAHNLKVFGD